ncbi:serine/threonine protein kinase, putative [Acanthamoeba castellanii str. Neff]|uniref:non-specific serine/threonine protein kinase n=1 Tax=Acanthamoeba castellanii (strain ATCC 30010 / Neff) TaxID=1257118 RepID=L8H4E6_ACACF|nr:serine/threonine protein kinase, putative [Acanthamoeba castellanii str. Neff]ELR20409.1 serine/threonine protein kinase, putative [Acanthamoeba castellanii str. Neff]
MVSYDHLVLRTSDIVSCVKAGTLVDFLYWTQVYPAALSLANDNSLSIPDHPEARARLARVITNTMCAGEPVSSFAACVSDGVICSDRGLCTTSGTCECDEGFAGSLCETLAPNSSDNMGVVLGAVLGSVLPVAVILIVVMCVAALVMRTRWRREKENEWEIDMEELEMAEELGTGGFGTVQKAVWKGTEVAVKTITSGNTAATRELERSFKEEVRIMTALRHPNVVLFMAACTKPPKMCIVMEFMALGSLFDLLHNELVSDIPLPLRIKIAYHAAKGMHFLHSSGIVHRDLKSLNLLLDSKWNVKVADFGLTQSKEQLARYEPTWQAEGSLHWMAPEVLNEAPEIDYAMADIYSFGIVLWELLTREQPYYGMTPAAIAVAVIRDNARPPVPGEQELTEAAVPAEYVELMRNAWHADPAIRPSFLEVMTRLSAMGDNGGWLSSVTSSSSMSSHDRSGASSSDSVSNPKDFGAASWDGFDAAVMRDATLLHNGLLRDLLKNHHGYEVIFIRDRTSGEGSFCMAFASMLDAVEWSMDVQRSLMEVEWPKALLEHPGAAEEWDDIHERPGLMFKGLRVRMGVHVGNPRVIRDPKTRRVEYIGPVVNAAARITAITHGGQIVMSREAKLKLNGSALADEHARFINLGKFEMPDNPAGSTLFEVKTRGLESRYFADTPLVPEVQAGSDDEARSLQSVPSGLHQSVRSGEMDQQLHIVGEGMTFKEDNFLMSANLCRWVIDYHDISIGKQARAEIAGEWTLSDDLRCGVGLRLQVGLGSYGTVYVGRWKGVEVAVKRFIKQQLDERRLLEFRAEMAFLSELHHPNIVLFIGACVKRPNLCIVTEFVKQGALKQVLADSAVRLAWPRRLRLLRSAAPSNLLVDEEWNVKVADFGFARIKEENATMTRCGTPCWTEVLGEGRRVLVRHYRVGDGHAQGTVCWAQLHGRHA